jgi:hypothetical protein
VDFPFFSPVSGWPVAAIAGYTLLELISRKVVHELRENCLAKVHPSLSAIAAAGHRPPPGAIFDQKKFIGVSI